MKSIINVILPYNLKSSVFICSNNIYYMLNSVGGINLNTVLLKSLNLLPNNDEKFSIVKIDYKNPSDYK
jgi:hypothetical protein